LGTRKRCPLFSLGNKSKFHFPEPELLRLHSRLHLPILLLSRILLSTFLGNPNLSVYLSFLLCKTHGRRKKSRDKMPENSVMTLDEISMERSNGFINALQELKSLRPQLYSAAEYCEMSYLHSDQKQMVLDNLKDYAVRVLVNAVDHLGTVAYKLNDLFEQQTYDVSTAELKIACLNQQLLACQTYTDKEGLGQHQLSTAVRRHHKHYILPNSVNKKVQSSPQKQTDIRQKLIQAKPRPRPSGSSSKTLSWHLASETDSELNGTPHASPGVEDHRYSGPNSQVFHLLDTKIAVSSTPELGHHQSSSGGPASRAVLKTFGMTQRDSPATKSLSAFRSFDTPDRCEIFHQPVHNKNLLSAFFVKHKSAKQRS
ncbi:protein ABIL1-like, partial [Magnolia sinica]|uniref:protein ABIL1-like n=1 Tax=Magnolia sinica TaxID=86752 RepID=UPI00265B7022